jgi:putative spermidine/putrescine transport system ATP-binding protein
MLETNSVTKHYGRTRAVDAASLSVQEGEFVCLLGPSGCGKSTLLRIIAGLAEQDSGSVHIAGEDVTRLAANARPTAMVFQSHALWSHMTVWRNVAFGLRVRRVAANEIRRRVAEVLDLVGLADFGHRRPGELSGGQAQRVALARCLVVQPKVLLMDEPFSALDAHLRQRLREELKALQRRLGITTIFVTHDQEEAMELADRIAVMNGGKIEQIGQPSDLYARPQSEFVATFIGAMNMGDAGVMDGQLVWQDGLWGDGGSASPIADGPVRIAIRPEDLRVATAGIEATVERAIDYGPSRRLALKTRSGDELKLTITEDLPPIGATLRLTPRRLTLYRAGRIIDQWHAPFLASQTDNALHEKTYA